MIPLDEMHRARQRTAIAKFLSSEIEETLGACQASHQVAAEVVATYWTMHCLDSTLNAEFISLLVSRALSAAGDAAAARDWLARRTNNPATANALMPLVESHDCTHVSLASVSSQLVRPEEWLFAGEQATWVLDCGQLVVHQAADMELVCFRALRALIEQVASVWDATNGRGTLGLRGVGQLAGLSDVEAFCAQVLAAIARRRGWPSVPAVVRLDIAT